MRCHRCPFFNTQLVILVWASLSLFETPVGWICFQHRSHSGPFQSIYFSKRTSHQESQHRPPVHLQHRWSPHTSGNDTSVELFFQRFLCLGVLFPSKPKASRVFLGFSVKRRERRKPWGWTSSSVASALAPRSLRSLRSCGFLFDDFWNNPTSQAFWKLPDV